MHCLYVVPTPIGNLQDITLRALGTLNAASLILAEDTRHTRKLLNRYDISTPLLSYHQHNKRARIDQVMQRLEDGDVALVSSAGMPSIADPGFELIQAAVERHVTVDVLPGASAVVTAVVAAAIPAPGFIFAGFLPRSVGDRRERLREVAAMPYALVVYEAPHRLRKVLSDALEVLGNRRIAVVREMTKVHQEVVRGTMEEVMAHFDDVEPRGELTLVIAGADRVLLDRSEETRDALRRLRTGGVDGREAVSAVVESLGISRNEAYKLWLQVNGEEQC